MSHSIRSVTAAPSTCQSRGWGDIRAIGTPIPSSRVRSVAIRRPGCTASLIRPSRSPSSAAAVSRSAHSRASPQNDAGLTSRPRVESSGTVSAVSVSLGATPTSSRMTSPSQKKSWRRRSLPTVNTRVRRRSSPAERSASEVRSMSGDIATRWSNPLTPLAWVWLGTAGGVSEVIASPSRGPSRPRIVTWVIPSPAAGSHTIVVDPIRVAEPSIEKPACAQAVGESPTVTMVSWNGWAGTARVSHAHARWPQPTTSLGSRLWATK